MSILVTHLQNVEIHLKILVPSSLKISQHGFLFSTWVNKFSAWYDIQIRSFFKSELDIFRKYFFLIWISTKLKTPLHSHLLSVPALHIPKYLPTQLLLGNAHKWSHSVPQESFQKSFLWQKLSIEIIGKSTKRSLNPKSTEKSLEIHRYFFLLLYFNLNWDVQCYLLSGLVFWN